MPRLSKKAKEKWSLFIHPDTGRRTYNDLCRKCVHPCKQSYRALVIEGGADKILDYADRPSFCLYSSGLSPPREILIRFSRYQTI